MKLLLLALATVALAALAACGGAGGASPAATSAPTAAAPQRIDVRLTDEMRIEPAEMNVPAGVPVTFVVTNVGQIEHEFYLGDEAAQQEHEEEMLSGEPMHGHSNAVTVAPGATEELTFTFAQADWLAGCHIPGHYPAGMKATITVTD
jgi:uncharacterized cupredoxin-like copper-binding protein